MLGITFNSDVLGPSLILGVATAGLYGLLAVSVVLTYRVSRTIGFVMGGIAFFGTFLYNWLSYGEVGSDPRLGRTPAVLLVVAVGGVIGGLYGVTVTGRRMANYPRIVLTTYSLSGLLILAGLAVSIIPAEERRLQSVFGNRTYKLFGTVVSIHQVATVVILVTLVALLTLVLRGTRTGTYVRAIADDVDASRYLGIRLSRVGTGVYALSGAVAALAGVLLASAVGTSPPSILLIFLRALVVSVLGGFVSLPLALAGCLLLGVGETMLNAGVFGVVENDVREIVLMSTIFGLVFLINHFRPIRVLEATGL